MERVIPYTPPVLPADPRDGLHALEALYPDICELDQILAPPAAIRLPAAPLPADEEMFPWLDGTPPSAQDVGVAMQALELIIREQRLTRMIQSLTEAGGQLSAARHRFLQLLIYRLDLIRAADAAGQQHDRMRARVLEFIQGSLLTFPDTWYLIGCSFSDAERQLPLFPEIPALDPVYNLAAAGPTRFPILPLSGRDHLEARRMCGLDQLSAVIESRLHV